MVGNPWRVMAAFSAIHPVPMMPTRIVWSCFIDVGCLDDWVVKTLLGTYDILEERAEDDVLSVAGYGAFVLTPKERPVATTQSNTDSTACSSTLSYKLRNIPHDGGRGYRCQCACVPNRDHYLGRCGTCSPRRTFQELD